MDRSNDGSNEIVDRLTFDQLHAQYALAVRRLATRLVGAADADDVTQEVMLRVYLNLGRLDLSRSLWPLLYVIIRRVSMTVVAKQSRYVLMDLDELTALVRETAPDPIEELITDEDRVVIRRAVAALKPMDRHLLTAHEFADVGISELAAVAGTTTGVVRVRLCRARRRLCQQLRYSGLGR